MRSVELAVYADTLAAEAAALNARLERARGQLRQAAIEREAGHALPDEIVARLIRLGLLGAAARATQSAAELEATRLDLAAVERLQTWVEAELAAAASGLSGPREAAATSEAEPERPPRLGAAA
jgi:hypothetical protein